MAEEITPQNSITESDFSRSSEIALIEKFFPEIRNFDGNEKDRQFSKKYKPIDNFVPKDNNKFPWIPERIDCCEDVEKHKKKGERKMLHKHLEASMSTVESDKTSSSCTASDFISNVYTKNGYIRGCNEKKSNRESNSLLKYNEFSSLISSLGKGSNFPVEVKLDEKEPTRKEDKHNGSLLNEENSVFIILGGIQMLLGILMAVFGVLVIAHNSSLSEAGSGLWGGAVAMFSGLMGILAGLKGCYSGDKHLARTSRTLLTIFLALCLISFALSNLVLVLTTTGLIRDIQRPKNYGERDEGEQNWPSLLADIGLTLTSALQCIATVFSSYKCYRKVCPCLRNDRNRLFETDFQNEKYKIEGKDRLVNHWLGQQFRMPIKKNKCEGRDNLVPWGTPNIVLLPPPPPMITNGQIPILTFLQAPSSVFGSCPPGHVYSNSIPCCCHHDPRYIPNPHGIKHSRRSSRKTSYIQPDCKVSKKHVHSKKERRASLPTTEEVARTYTGLDREIAEEFIAIAMDKGSKRSRNNSFAEYGIESRNHKHY